ncbi:hypothetical protein GCK72_020368 [Caenorhabditis remanei]|uniref:Uncharacterized protein n=1 Tax=Caenorhabditis remanei TaxID=31234 RepID=A0A6A5GGT5_CAERE|nr:hypothetical protein GCK72_020368 [Caenorhabditis remanei]KAF1753811.1 hypothetical protein GCK72_020368 [Caenorhabditis remanei]
MLGQLLLVSLLVSTQSAPFFAQDTNCDTAEAKKCARAVTRIPDALEEDLEFFCNPLKHCTDEVLLCNATLTEIQKVKSRCWVIPSPNPTSNPNTSTTNSTTVAPTTLPVSSTRQVTASSEEVTPAEETTEAPVANVTISTGTLGNPTTTTAQSPTTPTVSVNTTLPATTLLTDAPTTSSTSTSTTTESTTDVKTTPDAPSTVALTSPTSPTSTTTESTQGTTYHPPVTEPSSTGTTTWYFPKYLDIVTASCVAQLEAAGGQHSDLVNIVNGAIFVAEYMDPPIQFYQCYYLNDQYWMQRGLDSVSQVCGAYDANILRTRLINTRNQLGCDVFGTVVYTH